MTKNLTQLIELINKRLEELSYGEEPPGTLRTDKIHYEFGWQAYATTLGITSLWTFKENVERVLDQAIAVEVFHNFTLMHDDIMDEAPLRRGQATVHEKWNESVAILSGDVMLVKAYDLLLDAPSNLRQIIKDFNECAAGVCEGQQFDMNFEQLPTVAEATYINMIRLKTAVLLGYSLKLGAMLAEAPEEEAQKLYDFGVQVGIGFQLKDDLLDVYADQAKFGKQVGGDIIANKKTFLLLKALELANSNQKADLDRWINAEEFDSSEKVQDVMRIYDETGIKELTLAKMEKYFANGFKELEAIEVSEEKKTALADFTNYLINREK